MRLGKRFVPLLLVAALAGTALVSSGCAAPIAAAPTAPAERTMTVTGRGTVSAKPDLAQLSVGVETLAATVGEASQQNNTRMAALMAKLKELGIAEKDIQTSNFSINSERFTGKGEPSTDSQYRVTNMVQIKIRDLGKAGSILDAAIAAGANQVWGVGFTIEDRTALEGEARAKAMADAAQRAQTLAKLTGVQLGQIRLVDEGGATEPIYGGMALGKGAAGTSVNPGEVQLSYQVQVTYAIQ